MIAIDLGSNTIRFIEYNGEIWGKSFEKIVRTAENLHQTHTIGVKAIQRIVDAIHDAQKIIDFSSQEILAFTTAAMRLAENSIEVLDAIKHSTGIDFTVIDGEKEALLTLNAVRYRLRSLDLEPESFILADIGGGSTELTRCTRTNVETISLNVGIVTLSESINDEYTMENRIQSFTKMLEESLSGDCSTLVLTAGTPTTIAAYLLGMDYESYDPEKINGYRLSLADCNQVYRELLEMDEATRTLYVGVGRENLIIAGILMVTTIYTVMGCSEAIIVDDGLREGIALEYYNPS